MSPYARYVNKLCTSGVLHMSTNNVHLKQDKFFLDGNGFWSKQSAWAARAAGITHRRARWVLPFQARFKTFSCFISNSSKNQECIQTNYQFQARSENLNRKKPNFKQDSRTQNTKSQFRARFKNVKITIFNCQGEQNTPITPKYELNFM